MTDAENDDMAKIGQVQEGYWHAEGYWARRTKCRLPEHEEADVGSGNNNRSWKVHALL